MKTEYKEMQERKRKWIPLACAGKCTIAQASREIGITARAVCYLKRRFRADGDAVFVNAHAGKSYQAKKYSDSTREKICSIYRNFWAGANFCAFRDRLAQFHKINVGICSLKKILHERGIKSPKERKPKQKEIHLPRKSSAFLFARNALKYTPSHPRGCVN